MMSLVLSGIDASCQDASCQPISIRWVISTEKAVDTFTGDAAIGWLGGYAPHTGTTSLESYVPLVRFGHAQQSWCE
jgi:hypothetical protein